MDINAQPFHQFVHNLEQILSGINNHANRQDEILQQVLNRTTPAEPAAAPSQRNQRLKFALPEPFNGSRSEFRPFLAAINLIIHEHQQLYDTENSRITLVCTLFRGKAREWLTPFLESREAHPNMFATFEGFIAALSSRFTDVDAVRKAESGLRRLKQGNRTVDDYTTEFLSLLSHHLAGPKCDRYVPRRTK